MGKKETNEKYNCKDKLTAKKCDTSKFSCFIYHGCHARSTRSGEAL